MKKILALLLLFCLTLLPVKAEDFDTSIDDNIRKEYVNNTDLPPLPSAMPDSVTSGTAKPAGKAPAGADIQRASGRTYTVKHGTKVNLVSKTQLNDWMHKGQTVSFSSIEPVHTKEGITIPSGTIFKGRITDSHRPQITSNGGLIELCIDEVYFNGIMSKIDTKVSLVNSKRIYKNNIKGPHTYWHNFYKYLAPGRKVYKATSTCAGVLWPIPIVNILSIVPWSLGAVVYTVNFAVSPVIAIFSKGGSVSLPAGTYFEVKFKDNTRIAG